MFLENTKTIIRRDLERLKQELEAYQDEGIIWQVENKINNSAGTIGVHLVGNLNAYIGAELGHTGYIRDRDAEFAPRKIFRDELLDKIDQTIEVIEQSLNKVSEDSLDDEFPVPVSGMKVTIRYMLMHLTTHLAYHLGQVTYHRRLLDR